MHTHTHPRTHAHTQTRTRFDLENSYQVPLGLLLFSAGEGGDPITVYDDFSLWEPTGCTVCFWRCEHASFCAPCALFHSWFHSYSEICSLRYVLIVFSCSPSIFSFFIPNYSRHKWRFSPDVIPELHSSFQQSSRSSEITKWRTYMRTVSPNLASWFLPFL